jgi:hypothetical protein
MLPALLPLLSAAGGTSGALGALGGAGAAGGGGGLSSILGSGAIPQLSGMFSPEELQAPAGPSGPSELGFAQQMYGDMQQAEGLGAIDVGLNRALTAFDNYKTPVWMPSRSGWSGQLGPTNNIGISGLMSILGPSMSAGYGGGAY